jgi:hypothetical protein
MFPYYKSCHGNEISVAKGCGQSFGVLSSKGYTLNLFFKSDFKYSMLFIGRWRLKIIRRRKNQIFFGVCMHLPLH